MAGGIMPLQFYSAVFGPPIYVPSGLSDGASAISRLGAKCFVSADRHSLPHVPPLYRSFLLGPPP